MQTRVDHLALPQAVPRSRQAPLVVHIIYRLDVGGLENGLVNLINHLPEDSFRHAIICMTDYTDFRLRIQRKDVEVFALHTPPGKNIGVYFKLWRLLRSLRPAIVHTRNLATLEAQFVAALAGVPIRIHGEHGRDVGDYDGNNKKFQMLRRMFKPFVHRYIALSRDLEQYLSEKIHIKAKRVSQIYNGVDTERFNPREGERKAFPSPEFNAPGTFIIGTVGRMQTVKDQLTLVRAFILLQQKNPAAAQHLRLVILGDGPLHEEALTLLKHAQVESYAWLPGSRDDVAQLMRNFDLFILPSLAEGVSNTILEAMASGLPVVATNVGGNPELIQPGTGFLVAPADPKGMAAAIEHYFNDPELGQRHGYAARRLVEHSFSLSSMVNRYMQLYQQLLSARYHPLKPITTGT